MAHRSVPLEPNDPASALSTRPGRGAVAVVVAAAVLVGALAVGAGLSLVGTPTGTGGEGGTATEPRAGASSDGYAVWERNDDGDPVRWDPCTAIELVVAREGAPTGAMADLAEAVDRLVEVTGLEIRIVGSTDERPDADRPPYQPERYGERWAPVLIAWSPPHEGGIRLRTTDRGVAIPIAVGPPGDRTYVTAQVAFNTDRVDLVPGFEDRSRSWGSTILHELAHVVGLDHVDEPSELMYVYPGEGPVEFGRGDLTGLAALGAEQGCRQVPRPQHVEVTEPPGR